MGDIPWDYAAIIMGIAFVTTLVGQIAIDRLVTHLGRGSIVVIVLACFFICACLLAWFVAATSIAAWTRDPSEIHVPGICSAL
jgi:MFS family permease